MTSGNVIIREEGRGKREEGIGNREEGRGMGMGKREEGRYKKNIRRKADVFLIACFA